MLKNSTSPSTLSKLQFQFGRTSHIRLAYQRRVILPSPKGRSFCKLQPKERSFYKLQPKGRSPSKLHGRRRSLDMPRGKGRSNNNKSPPPMLKGDLQVVTFVTKQGKSNGGVSERPMSKRGRSSGFQRRQNLREVQIPFSFLKSTYDYTYSFKMFSKLLSKGYQNEL